MTKARDLLHWLEDLPEQDHMIVMECCCGKHHTEIASLDVEEDRVVLVADEKVKS